MPNTLALLAHPSRVVPLVDWLTKNQALLHQFQLTMTADIADHLAAGWGVPAERRAQGWGEAVVGPNALRSPEQGGDIELAAQILAGEIAGVFFYVDPLAIATGYPSLEVIMRACQTRGIPMAVNEASATLLLRGLAKTQVAYLIFNPVAGQGNPDFDLSLIREILEPQILVNTIMTKPNVNPADQAREAIAAIQNRGQEDLGSRLIIASGGDGTVSAVAQATLGTGIPLGIIPRGTANAFSVGLGIPTDLRGACTTILAGNTHVVDAARCNDTPMILLAGLGFEAGMVNRASRELKNRIGPLAYVLAGAQQLATALPFKAILEVDDQTLELQTAAITVANVAPPTSVLAQGMGQVIPDDGLLDVTISTSKTRLQGFNAFAAVVTAAVVKTPTQRDDILCFRTPRLKVTTDPPQTLVIDGEIVTANPVVFEAIPRGLTIFSPMRTMLSGA